MATNGDSSGAEASRRKGSLLLLFVVLGGALAAVCHQAFLPHRIMWANDVPLGAMIDPSNRLPGTFAGHWANSEYIGGSGPSPSPSLSSILQIVLTPQMYLKIYAPLSMFILGLGAWLFFRQLGFSRPTCVLGGVGAGLNMHFFSNACWGLGQWNITSGMMLIALAVIVSPSIRPHWVKCALTGLCTGMMVMEGFDVGAILSVYVGIFIVFYSLIDSPTPTKAIPKTLFTGVIVVIFALFIGSCTLYTLVGTQIKGTSIGGQSAGEKKRDWDFATQWSFPKLETIRLIIPGIMGYRLQDYITDTNKASAYWGKIAEDPHISELESSNPEARRASAANLGVSPEIQDIMASNDVNTREQVLDQIKGALQRRHTGSGDYTGVVVVLLAFFGLFNVWRKNAVYSDTERKEVWFWGIAALISLMAAWGRYGEVFQFIFHLPFFHDIRNPIKYLHPLNISIIILSGYGMESLYRRYVNVPSTRGAAQSQSWWERASSFDKKWTVGTILIVLASVVGLIVMISSKADLAHYLAHNGFSDEIAPRMAAFSITEVAWYLLFISAAVALLISILAGAWTGPRMKWAWICLGALIILDLTRADVPWVRYFDWTQKYSENAVIDFLKDKPSEFRVMSRFSPTGGYIPGDGTLGALCHWWLENDYLANNIVSLEIDQAPRLPILDSSYINDFNIRSQQDLSPPVRMWRLTDTRYILADARWKDAFNQFAEPHNSFSNVMLLDVQQKPGVSTVEDAGDLTLVPNPNGHIALMEFTKALPRAKLYASWEIDNDNTTLAKLDSKEFDPAKTVIVSDTTPLTEKPADPNADPGTVKITEYKPRDVLLEAQAKTPCVMLLNDRVGDYWKVWIDGKPSTILRCNYIMRGVYLTPGHHTIEFHFQAPLQWFYVTSTGCVVGLVLAGYVAVSHARKKKD